MAPSLASPRFTIFTPTYQSAQYLDRVFESLTQQTLQDFEWLVVDDASQDETLSLLADYQSRAVFPIVVLTKPENRGLMHSYNMAVAHARGEFFLPAGHDDRFPPEALAIFLAAWESIPTEFRSGFSGVTGLCQDEAGQVLEPFPADVIDSDPIEMYFRHRIRREKWGFQRTDVLRHFPFPEQFRYAMESAFVWFPIGRTYRTRYINRVVRTYYRDNAQGLSQSIRIRHAGGLAASYRELLPYALAHPAQNAREIVLMITRYLRFSVHAGESMPAALARLGGAERTLGFFVSPLSWYMILTDRYRGRI